MHSILEVGIGIGNTAKFLLQNKAKACAYLGIDLNNDMVVNINNWISDKSLHGAKALQADGCQFIKKESFDLIISDSVINLMGVQSVLFMHNCLENLTTNGCLVLRELASPEEYDNPLCQSFFLKTWSARILSKDKYYHHSSSEVMNMLKSLNFNVSNCLYDEIEFDFNSTEWAPFFAHSELHALFFSQTEKFRSSLKTFTIIAQK
jgi:cyclopropane fatty-acyl-phospholipid synthase-like methyltransferase